MPGGQFPIRLTTLSKTSGFVSCSWLPAHQISSFLSLANALKGKAVFSVLLSEFPVSFRFCPLIIPLKFDRLSMHLFIYLFKVDRMCFFFKYIYLFIYFWLHWVFIAARGLSLVVASGGYSLLWCAGFSLWWLLLLQSTGSRRAGFGSCGTWAQ